MFIVVYCMAAPDPDEIGIVDAPKPLDGTELTRGGAGIVVEFRVVGGFLITGGTRGTAGTSGAAGVLPFPEAEVTGRALGVPSRCSGVSDDSSALIYCHTYRHLRPAEPMPLWTLRDYPPLQEAEVMPPVGEL